MSHHVRRRCSSGPLRGEASGVAADDWDVGDLADVEAGCADDDIEGVENIVSGVNSIGVDAGYGGVG